MKGKLLHASLINSFVRHNAVFSFSFVAKNGEIIKGLNCVCTSFFSAGRTMNVKWLDSGEIRKIRRCSIIMFNNLEVVL